MNQFGLLPLPQDKRDLKLGRVFGFAKLTDVPDTDFMVAEPLEIKDQKETDMCPAFSTCAASEDQEGVLLEPGYTFAKIKQLIGNPHGFGATMRDGLKAGVKFGFLEKAKSPFHYPAQSRDFLADWNNWPKQCDEDAVKHRKGGYLFVDGPYDTFDNIRAALWHHRNDPDGKKSVMVGAKWRESWQFSNKGIIPILSPQDEPAEGHMFVIKGQKVINGDLRLVAQGSSGIAVGDNGLFYFPREVVNREFKDFGQAMFKDASPEDMRKVQNSFINTLNYYFQILKALVAHKLLITS